MVSIQTVKFLFTRIFSRPIGRLFHFRQYHSCPEPVGPSASSKRDRLGSRLFPATEHEAHRRSDSGSLDGIGQPTTSTTNPYRRWNKFIIGMNDRSTLEVKKNPTTAASLTCHRGISTCSITQPGQQEYNTQVADEHECQVISPSPFHQPS